MRLTPTRSVLLVVAVFVIAACGAATPTSPTAPSEMASPTSTAVATPAPPSIDPTVSPSSWSAAGRMSETRVEHSATLLPDGRVLIAGGFRDGEANEPRASAELYDPATRSWTRTGDMLEARAAHAATLLLDGTVLVAGGGTSPTAPLKSAEIYDPATESWTATAPMRSGASATSRYCSQMVVFSSAAARCLAGRPPRRSTTHQRGPGAPPPAQRYPAAAQRPSVCPTARSSLPAASITSASGGASRFFPMRVMVSPSA